MFFYFECGLFKTYMLIIKLKRSNIKYPRKGNHIYFKWLNFYYVGESISYY